MRYFLVTGFLLAALAGAAQAKMKFSDPKQNFGFVKKGEKVVLKFEFTNVGTEPLLISEAKAGCSCTTADWPDDPIPPGQKGVIVVTFDSTPAYDRQDRTVEVFSNAKSSPDKVRFKGVVLQ
jgi:hypothetical protein